MNYVLYNRISCLWACVHYNVIYWLEDFSISFSPLNVLPSLGNFSANEDDTPNNTASYFWLPHCQKSWPYPTSILLSKLTSQKYPRQLHLWNIKFQYLIWCSWVAQSVKCLTSAQVLISQFVGSSSDRALCWQLGDWCLLQIVSFSLCLSPTHAVSLCLSNINVKKNKKLSI